MAEEINVWAKWNTAALSGCEYETSKVQICVC
jgi:hypothetical protein